MVRPSQRPPSLEVASFFEEVFAMKQLSKLHEEFMDKARRPMTFGALPVTPKTSDLPVIPVNKWVRRDNALHKTYTFRLQEQRNQFVKDLLDHEVEVGHHADVSITEGSVALRLQTKDINEVTELDKEYAAWADEHYKDVVYSVPHDRRR